MRHLVPLLIVLFSAVVSYAQPPLTITEKGYFLTYINDSGVPEFVKVNNVTDLRQTPTTPLPPEKPEPPTPSVDKAIVDLAKSWSLAERDTDAAQALALTYINVMQAVDEGKVPSKNAWQAIKAATDKTLIILAKPDKYSTFRKQVSDLVASKTSKGELADKAATVNLIKSIEYGLELSADGATSLPNGTQIQIIQSTNGVIDDYR